MPAELRQPDCLIIGGGVIGLSIAYELVAHGQSVRVIDQGEPGKEASWAGAGILPPASSTIEHPYDRLRALSHQLHPTWAQHLTEESGIDTGFRNCGGIYIARSSGEAAALHGMKSLLDEENVSCERLTLSQLGELEPAFEHLTAEKKIKAAYRLPTESQLRNPDHLRALRKCCELRGVEIISDTKLTSFELTESGISSAATSRGTMTAANYCVCSGAWTHYLIKQLGIANGIMPIRGQMVMFQVDAPPFRHIINEGPRYLVPRDDGRVLVGSTEEEVGYEKGTTVEAIDELTTLAGELVESLTSDRVERTWSGLRPGSYDGFPYIGAIPGMSNAFVAAGHFRSGLFLSPATAVVMRQVILGQTPEIDLTPFRVGRG